MSLTDIIPAPYRWAAFSGLLLAGVGAGFVLGIEYEADRHATQLSQIAAAGAAQTATAHAETARKAENNQENSNGYTSAAAHLVARFERQPLANQPGQPGAGSPAAPAGALVGLRLPAAAGGSSGMPDHTGARSGADAAAAQPGADGAGGTAGDSGDVKALTRNAAADALQVLWLQDYVARVCLSAAR